jgi:hypothetical protein
MTTHFIARATTKRQHKLCKSKIFVSRFRTQFPKNLSSQLWMNVLNICVAFSDTISQKSIQATLDECPISLVSNLSL